MPLELELIGNVFSIYTETNGQINTILTNKISVLEMEEKKKKYIYIYIYEEHTFRKISVDRSKALLAISLPPLDSINST